MSVSKIIFWIFVIWMAARVGIYTGDLAQLKKLQIENVKLSIQVMQNQLAIDKTRGL